MRTTIRTGSGAIAAVGQRRIRIVFVLTEFVVGGAEMMLWKLLSRMDRSQFEPLIIALSPRADSMLDRFARIGVQCRLLGMHHSLKGLMALLRLRSVFRQFQPDIVQGWMYHANLAATVGGALAGSPAPVLWNVRGALIDRRHQKFLSSFVVWVTGRLSGCPSSIINNSLASALEHEARLGYPAAKRLILPNGFAPEEFCPSPTARLAIRSELGVAQDAVLVGLIGRYHPMKDHGNFLRAAAIIKQTHPGVHFVLAGENVEEGNKELGAAIASCGLQGCVHLLGLRADMPHVTAALDVATSSSSSGEGFPNVVGEAMSCGVPCVVTDVGDSAAVVGNTGRSVEPRDSAALARAICELLEMPAGDRAALGARARERVIRKYSLEAVVRSYEDLYLDVYERSLDTRRP